VVCLWLLLLHICTVLFKCIIVCIRKSQQLQGEIEREAAVSTSWTTGKRQSKASHPDSIAQNTQL
jgi:hypothetical protein